MTTTTNTHSAGESHATIESHNVAYAEAHKAHGYRFWSAGAYIDVTADTEAEAREHVRGMKGFALGLVQKDVFICVGGFNPDGPVEQSW